jgi:hypothetical protein
MTDNRFATRLETNTAKVVEIFKIKNKIKINKKDIKKKHRVGLIGNLSSLTNTQSIIMQTTKLPF